MKRLATAAVLTLAACGNTPPPPAPEQVVRQPPNESDRTTAHAADPTVGLGQVVYVANIPPPPRPKARVARTRPRPANTPKAATRGGGCTLEVIRRKESGGNYRAVSPSGKYRGAYQFDAATWRSVGGTGDPAAAPPAEQDARAAELMRRRGTQPWSVCR